MPPPLAPPLGHVVQLLRRAAAWEARHLSVGRVARLFFSPVRIVIRGLGIEGVAPAGLGKAHEGGIGVAPVGAPHPRGQLDQ